MREHWRPLETTLPDMTVRNTNSTAGDYSISQGSENRPDTPTNDRVLVQIIEYAYEMAGTTARRALEIEAQWNTTGLDQRLDRLEAISYVELFGVSDGQMIMLTSRDDFLARRRR